MSTAKAAVAVVTLFIVAVSCVSQAPTAFEERALNLDKSLICPVCPGETVDQSNVELAKQMRTVIREKLEAGWGDEEILQFFVSRYGNDVLASPPTTGFTLVAWIAPLLIIVLGFAILFLALRRMRPSSEPNIVAENLDLELEPYLSQAQQELEDSIPTEPHSTTQSQERE